MAKRRSSLPPREVVVVQRYGVYDDQGRKVNTFLWDGVSPLPTRFRQDNWTVRADDGKEIWTPPPVAVSPAQFRKGLRLTGKWNDFNAFIQSLPEDVRDDVEYATEIRRRHPLVDAGRRRMGMTEEQVDDLFRFMATL